MSEEKLNRATIRLLRKVQKFLIEEPRRFDMQEGIKPAQNISTILEQPPCGTACCIAGAAYVIDRDLVLDNSSVGFGDIEMHLAYKFNLSQEQRERLFYIDGVHQYQLAGCTAWPEFYGLAYKNATTPLERACIGVARIEHFIATDGRE